jgi:hypothetical protein
MKRVTLKAGATIDGLNSANVGAFLSAVGKQLEVIALGASPGSNLDLVVSVRGSVLSNNPGAMVAAHSEIGDALRLAVRGGVEIEEDLGISTVREPKPSPAPEPRAAKVEKGGVA